MLSQKIDLLKFYLEEHNLDAEFKEIPYGQRCVLFGGGVQVNLYWGKKGFSYHLQGKDKGALEELKLELALLFQGEQPGTGTDKFCNSYDFTWIGTDETGKGDFFGPLVVSGCRLEKGDHIGLLSLGVADSKKLTDQKMEIMARDIRQLLSGRFKCLVLNPSKYNELYDSFRSQGKNLNHLMSWAHTKVIEDIYTDDTRLAIVDQFAKNCPVERSLKTKLPELKVLEQTRAEANLAVAAASILARSKLIDWHKRMSSELGFSLPYGAGPQTIAPARRIIDRASREELSQYVKLHFKTTQEL